MSMAENGKAELTGWQKSAQRTIESLQSAIETAQTWGELSNRARDELEDAAAEMRHTSQEFRTSRRIRREAELARKRQLAAEEAERSEHVPQPGGVIPRIRL